MNGVHVYTSITANYLPKARVLAHSVKEHYPEACFHLLLCDVLPADIIWDDEPFDRLITIDDLDIPESKAWTFGHSVVELCTAVKGAGLLKLLAEPDAECALYFDPDIAVLGDLGDLIREFESASVLLTPHQTQPEATTEAIMDNEMASLKYGVFNLGFLGVKNTDEGLRFGRWWASRLHDFCQDDRPSGLFTDQKWVNLAPCFFDDIKVLRSPSYNVATWNITNRKIDGSFDAGFTSNGEPLVFYHFSGFDSGDQALMLGKYGANNKALKDLRAWYIDSCESFGQSDLGKLPGIYGSYDNGESISREERALYRRRIDLQRAFPDPYTVTEMGGYLAWYRANAAPAVEDDSGEHSVQSSEQDSAQDPAQVLADFRAWLNERALLSSSCLRRFALRSLSRFLGVAALAFGRSGP